VGIASARLLSKTTKLMATLDDANQQGLGNAVNSSGRHRLVGFVLEKAGTISLVSLPGNATGPS
jgi:hypothetical protein